MSIGILLLLITGFVESVTVIICVVKEVHLKIKLGTHRILSFIENLFKRKQTTHLVSLKSGKYLLDGAKRFGASLLS